MKKTRETRIRMSLVFIFCVSAYNVIDVQIPVRYNMSRENCTGWRRLYVSSELYEFKR